MNTKRLDRIRAAMRLKTAMRANKRPQRPLIDPYRPNKPLDEHTGNHRVSTLSSARRRSPISKSNGRDRVVSRPISTKSTP